MPSLDRRRQSSAGSASSLAARSALPRTPVASGEYTITPVPLPTAPRDHLAERALAQQAQLRLHTVDVPDVLAAIQQCDVEVRDARPPHLSLLHQLGHRRPRRLDRRPRVRVVELVQVDPLDAEPTEAPLALRSDRGGLRSVRMRSGGSHGWRALGEDEHVLADRPRLEGSRDDLLGVTETVRGGGVDPGDSALHRAADRRHRGGVVAPRAVRPRPRSARLPAAEADTADRRPRLPQRGGRSPPPWLPPAPHARSASTSGRSTRSKNSASSGSCAPHGSIRFRRSTPISA